MIRRPPRSTLSSSSAASDVYKRQVWDCGAWHGASWFQYPWNVEEPGLDITVKELFPVVMAGAIWGHRWNGYHITNHCDNQAVVAVLNSRTSREKHLMHLLRCSFFYEAYWLNIYRGLAMVEQIISPEVIYLPFSPRSRRPTGIHPQFHYPSQACYSLRTKTGHPHPGLGRSNVL